MVQFCGMSYFCNISFAISKLCSSISTTSRIMSFPSYFFKMRGMKLPTPTDGSRILTACWSVSGNDFIISVMSVLLVKKAALSVRLVFANSAILPNVAADKDISFCTIKLLSFSTSANPYSFTILLIVAVFIGGCFRTAAIFLAIAWNIAVGTASPNDCLILISSFFKNALFLAVESLLSVSKSSSTHLKEYGTVIISISSLMLKTLSSLG